MKARAVSDDKTLTLVIINPCKISTQQTATYVKDFGIDSVSADQLKKFLQSDAGVILSDVHLLIYT